MSKLDKCTDYKTFEDQKLFDAGMKSCNLLVNPDNLYKLATKNVSMLSLSHYLPTTVNFTKLLKNLVNLQFLDLSNNNIGPQAFRALCLAMCNNVTILSLNLSDNRADTDSAFCIGELLEKNKTLNYIDVSGNNLGKDYFSRCVGPALKTNTTLTTLRAQSVGSVDMKVLLEGLLKNTCLLELDLSSNQITDRCGLGTQLGTYLKNTSQKVTSIRVSNCNINSNGIKLLLEGFKLNHSIVDLNLSGNEFGEMQLLYEFLVCTLQHKTLTHLCINDAKISNTSYQSQDIPTPSVSPLQILRLSSSKVTSQLLSDLARNFSGKLSNLCELDLSNNSDLKPVCLNDVVQLTSDVNGKNCLEKLIFGLNECDSLSACFKTHFDNLVYLNLRKAKFSVTGLVCISHIVRNKDLAISTLVLDGLKFSGTEALTILCSSLSSSKITAISLDGCSLSDSDLVPFCVAMTTGFKLHMLKLSANRLTDEFILQLVESLLKTKNYPLAILDVSNNQLTDKSGIELSQLYTKAGYTSFLHSLNLKTNNLGFNGIISLICCMGHKFVLKTLYVNNQRQSLQESEVIEIGLKLANGLGYKVNNKDGIIQIGCGELPDLPEGFYVNISGLGGNTGDIGYKLDCSTIITDLSSRQLLNLSFSDIMELVSVLKGYGAGECIFTLEEFNQITGACKDREVPSWLQLAGKRDLGLYLSNLPGSATVNKLEAIFEMEADCSVNEICLMKDPVSRCNNGVGWLLMSDSISLDKATDFFQQGEARIFGQPFMISRIKVNIHDSASLEIESKARQDMEERLNQRRLDDAAYRQLIQQNTEESWKRHAYRLAHPAYADGRIW